MITRKKYSNEFKLDAISLVLKQDYTRVKVAKNLVINGTINLKRIRNFFFIQLIDGMKFLIVHKGIAEQAKKR